MSEFQSGSVSGADVAEYERFELVVGGGEDHDFTAFVSVSNRFPGLPQIGQIPPFPAKIG